MDNLCRMLATAQQHYYLEITSLLWLRTASAETANSRNPGSKAAYDLFYFFKLHFQTQYSAAELLENICLHSQTYFPQFLTKLSNFDLYQYYNVSLLGNNSDFGYMNKNGITTL